MRNSKLSAAILFGAVCGVGGVLTAGVVDLPHTFGDGEVAAAGEVNANFTEVKAQVDSHNTRIGTLEGNAQWSQAGDHYYHTGSPGRVSINSSSTNGAVVHIRAQNDGGSTPFEITRTDGSSPILRIDSGGQTGAQPNGAATPLKVWQNNSGRSISAAGSINASGADFAEKVPWAGPKPEPGSIVRYKNTNMVVSHPHQVAYVANDGVDDEASLLLAFAGQVACKMVPGVAIEEGDYIVPSIDDPARGVPVRQAAVTVQDLVNAVGIAWEASDGTKDEIKIGVGLK